MATMVGADVAELRSLAKQFTSAARTIDNAGRQLTPAINRGTWQGHDAARFRETWNGTLQPKLGAVAESVRRSADILRQNADEQERASGEGGTFGGGSTGGGNSFLDTVRDAWNWFSQGRKVLSNLSKLNKIRSLWQIYSAADALSAVNAAASSAKVFLAADMANIALGRAGLFANMLGRLGPAGAAIGKWAGPVGAVLAIGSGIHDMIDPAHDGWRGWGDRAAGLLSVGSGAGILALAAGVSLGPIAVGGIIAAGAVAGAWTLGNMIWDNREAIGEWIGNAAGAVGDFFGGAGETLGNLASSVTDSAFEVVESWTGGAGKVANWTKGLFS